MKKISTLLMLTLLVFIQSVVAGTITPEKRGLIEKIVEETEESILAKGNQLSKDYIQQMAIILKDIDPNIDPRAFAILEEEAKKDIHEISKGHIKLLKKQYQIYDKHFTIEELKQVIEFKDTSEIELKMTPFGKKIINVYFLIDQEYDQDEQAFLQFESPDIMQRVFTRLEKEGIK